MPKFVVESKGRLDAFLAKAAAISRVRAGQLVRDGCVTVNGRVTKKPAHIVEPENSVEASIAGLPATETHVIASDLQLHVLYEDDDCLVLDKPDHIAVHPATGIPKSEATILHGIAHLFAERKIPFVASHVLAHRLDKETTGCLLIAKNSDAHRALQKQFLDRTVKKTYLAIVHGIPKAPQATIDAPIGRSTMNRTKMAVHHATATRSAQTTYRMLSRSDEAALLACDLHTGRTHQLRVHLSTIGHPILGDPTYHTRGSDAFAAKMRIDTLCLHAWKLQFHSPKTEKAVSVVAKPPPPFLQVCEGLRLVVPN